MRIEISKSIKVCGKIEIPDFLKGLKKGSELSARIVERASGREAILEIAGKRIHAEFLKGVPASNRLILKLEESGNNSYIFKLVDTLDKDIFLKELLEFTVFKTKDINKNFISVMSNFLNKNPKGVFELNALLLNFFSKQNRKEDINEKIKKIINEFDNIVKSNSIVKDNEKDNIIQKIIELLSFRTDEPGKFNYGELAYFDDDEIRTIKYIGKQSSWIFSIELSNIGRIDILAKKTTEGLDISILSNRNDVIKVFKESQDKLITDLGKISANIHINIYNLDNIINKMVEINSYYTMNSVFDVKV